MDIFAQDKDHSKLVSISILYTFLSKYPPIHLEDSLLAHIHKYYHPTKPMLFLELNMPSEHLYTLSQISCRHKCVAILSLMLFLFQMGYNVSYTDFHLLIYNPQDILYFYGFLKLNLPYILLRIEPLSTCSSLYPQQL